MLVLGGSSSHAVCVPVRLCCVNVFLGMRMLLEVRAESPHACSHVLVAASTDSGCMQLLALTVRLSGLHACCQTRAPGTMWPGKALDVCCLEGCPLLLAS